MSAFRPYLLVLLIALLALVALPATAMAAPGGNPGPPGGGGGGGGGGGPKPPKASTCPTADDLSQPFANDPFFYFLAPGGSFESGAWSGGTAVEGNEPDFVTGNTSDHQSLQIAAGSSATSPATCIGLDDPTIRFYAKGPAASLLGVSVVYKGLMGGEQTLALTPIPGALDGDWEVTVPTPILANATVAPKAIGTDPVNGDPVTDVKFVFTPSVGSTWQIDDVHVDPYRRS